MKSSNFIVVFIRYAVAPYAGAWIEIGKIVDFSLTEKSLLMQERGLKLVLCCVLFPGLVVAPYAGAWIEIDLRRDKQLKKLVAPYAGAWIEIMEVAEMMEVNHVAPYAGAWIEIYTKQLNR